MNSKAASILVLVLVGIIIFLPVEAPARVHFSIGVGTAFGCPYPYHSWCGDWYWHRYPHVWRHGDCYPCRPWCRPTVGVWLVHWPAVVAEKHVVVEKRVVDCPAPARPEAGPAFEAATRRRTELVKVLRIGDVDDRVGAAQELAGYPYDRAAGKALEQALLSDRDPLVRQAAAESLRKLKDGRALPTLKRAYAEDPVREVRQAAYKAIIMIEGY